MAMRGPRLQVGSAAWVAEERSSALQIAQAEVEEFSFSARNELEWLNEHMAGIFDENETNFAETFKTPGKLRGKTPRTALKSNASESRAPLSDVFAATPNGSTNRFAQKLNRVNSPKTQTIAAKSSSSPSKPVARKQNAPGAEMAGPGGAYQDSGYFGSQDVHSSHARDEEELLYSQQTPAGEPTATGVYMSDTLIRTDSSEEYQAKEVVSSDALVEMEQDDEASEVEDVKDVVMEEDDVPDSEQPVLTSEAKTALEASSDPVASPAHSVESALDDARSNLDASSPIRPLVRKSSLNFASLPAREPLTAGKSLGTRASRTSYFDTNRKSQYNWAAGGKTPGKPTQDTDDAEEEDREELKNEEIARPAEVNPALNHNKTYTQRLQDQINLLGKSKPSGSRPSKSTHNLASLQQAAAPSQPTEVSKSPSPKPAEATTTTPGAFPEDDDDWIDPPVASPTFTKPQSPISPPLPKSHSADVMEGIHENDRISDVNFEPPTHERGGQSVSPQRAPTHQTALNTPGHAKSVSVPTVPLLPRAVTDQTLPLTKAFSIPLSSMLDGDGAQTPSHSSSRSFRDSPLKQVKNKLSSILKSSKGLLASSAAVSAEGKSSLLSPSTTRMGFHVTASTESLATRAFGNNVAADKDDDKTLPVARRTRASLEREKEEKRRQAEARLQEQQTDKLEKAREKEREKARVFSKEQERIAAMEKQMSKDGERAPVLETPEPTKSSTGKIQRQPETVTNIVDRSVDMADAPPLAPPSAHRPATASQVARPKEIKRPTRPTREAQAKAKQAPTVIRVNTGSQHSQYHSTASTITANAPESVAPSTAPQSQPAAPAKASKASKAALQSKPSTQSLKASTSSNGRAKVPDSASQKREQEEREAQRRREAKAEMERKRAAAQEEQRRQEQRRQEAERQKQRDREQAAAHAEAKQTSQSAQRQAMLEKAKQTKAPPPATRSHQNGPPDFGSSTREAQPSRPPSRMDSGHPTQASKAGMKRNPAQEANDDYNAKRQPSRGGPSYQAKDAKRRRTSEAGETEVDNPPNIKGPPVRPSAAFKKELPKKSLFQNGYTNAPPSATRDLFKATVTSQYNNQHKSPLDMAQISKGAIPFAPANANHHGSSSYKTPARPPAAHGSKSTAKSAQRSSPRFQNGESIELPEIDTDDEDDEDGGGRGMVAPWVESPELRMALLRQETLDPTDIFGPPRPLNMEEVFSKNKDRWHKFRARTSSANWSGFDRLTEEDIQKDMAARDKMRREGGWSFELSKDL
ncbi:Inner centromere protein, ARK binding region [Geosmithia morbida]|uniref:Inner centromere protein, ARK binding region n=1 Tax=Geosmithia morbida TaxID=1094350 RepID=A0A9P4Z196_9HYPO|nr:Inner centromere protein, ARK binding region [Geosmithia morbida]KAF4126735.1 Inner centromere protein, ARK binding region [Geosmithia morbida]